MAETLANCKGCGTELAPNLLTCPNCNRLVHAERLKALADEAGQATSPVEAMVAWRSALELLPPGTRQYEVIQGKITALGQVVDAMPNVPPPKASDKGKWGGGAAGLGTLGLLAWKFKAFLFIALTKGKLLLMGLTKASTFTSMALSFGIYWTMFGWPLALGLLLSIYIHEMGHVFALMRYGIKATAPMFIPGFGALILLKQGLGDPRQDARVGLAGPIWGLGAALVSWALGLATGLPIFAVIARLGALINLFNLLPIWTLDGGRAFRSMTKGQRLLAILGIVAARVLSQDSEAQGFLILLILGGIFTTLTTPAAQKQDREGFFVYIVLVGALSLLMEIPDPVAAG